MPLIKLKSIIPFQMGQTLHTTFYFLHVVISTAKKIAVFYFCALITGLGAIMIVESRLGELIAVTTRLITAEHG